MRTLNLDVNADGTVTDMSAAGGFLGVVSVTGNHTISISWLTEGGMLGGRVQNARVGQRYYVPFSGLRVEGTAGDEIALLIGERGEDADPPNEAPTFTIGNSSTSPVPTVENPATAGVNNAQVAVTDADAVLIAAAAARCALVVRNVGDNEVAIYNTAATTFAAAAMRMLPGEERREETGAPLAWRCRCDAGLASTLNVQVMTR